MAVDLARYIVSLEAQTATYVKELDKANRKLDRFQKDQERALAGIKKAFLNFGVTLASALSIRAIVNFTKASIDMADQIGEISKAAGVSAETLQELRFAFDKLGGIASGATDQGLQRFNRQLGLAINGSKQAQDQFKLLGVTLSRDLSTEETLDATLEALGRVRNDAQRAAIAGRLFGQEMGPKLAAALGGGAGALEKARQQVVGLISNERVAEAGLLDDAFKEMANSIGGRLKSAAIEATAAIADLFGLIDRGPVGKLQEQIEDARRRIEAFQQAEAAGALGGNRILLDRAIEEKERLEAQLRLAQNFTPFSERAARRQQRDVPPELGDGLEEITAGVQRLGTPLDHVVAQFNQMFSAEGIQEFSDVVVKMPNDLQKLSPAFNDAVLANERVISGLKETDKQAQELAETMGSAFSDAFNSWILGAERSFGDFLKRLAVQLATSAIFKTLGSFFPGGTFLSNFFAGARAEGGPVSGGRAYLVGERGPEIFIPSGSGMIAAGAGGGLVYNDNSTFNFSGNRDDVPMLRAVLAQHKREVMAEIKDKQRRGRF